MQAGREEGRSESMYGRKGRARGGREGEGQTRCLAG